MSQGAWVWAVGIYSCSYGNFGSGLGFAARRLSFEAGGLGHLRAREREGLKAL